jgi:hypothetical protein
MHSEVKSKLLTTFLLILFFGISGSEFSRAATIPQLKWERGRQQVVTLGGHTSEKLWTLKLIGSKSSLVFKRSSVNKSGFLVYSVDIPSNFPVGDYEVQVSGPDEKTVTTAYVKILEQVSYDPLTDPKGVGLISVIAFTLLSFFGNSGQNSDQSSDSSSIGSIDTNYHGIQNKFRGKLDKNRLTRNRFGKWFDQLRHIWVMELAPRSPLISRIIADGTYVQSILGPFVLLLPITGLFLGFEIGNLDSSNSSLIPTSVGLVVVVVVLGILDSFAGITAFLTFLVTIAIHGKIQNATDIRTILGLSLLWFTPALAAGATRPLRRDSNEWDAWERISDVIISSLFTGWAIKGMALALDGFSHQKTVLASNSNLLAIFGGSAILIRYLVEELATRVAPIRVEYLTPPRIKEQYFDSFLISLFIKTILYIFFMLGFFGLCWQLFVSICFLIIPSLLKRFSNRLPNIPSLWQIIPGGVPAIVFTSLVGFLFMNWVNSLPLVSSDKTKTILVLTSIPGLFIGLLKLFGRDPKSGDIRWYRRPKMKIFYRVTGPIILIIAILITVGAIP